MLQRQLEQKFRHARVLASPHHQFVAALATGVLILLFFLVGVPSNLVVIISILKKRLYRLPTHILLLNLAISDLLVCLFVMPFTIIAAFAGGYIFGSSDYIRCRVCEGSVVFTALTFFSVCILSLISVDRFIFIKFSLYYEKWVTRRKIFIIITILWLLSLFVSLLPLFGFGEIEFVWGVTSHSKHQLHDIFGYLGNYSNDCDDCH